MTIALLTALAALLGGLLAAVLVLRRIPVRWLRPWPAGELRHADHFVVFAMGLVGESAGASNVALADWLIENNPERRPTIVQEGVYRALRERESELDLSAWVLRLPHDPDVYVDTIGASLQSWALTASRGWSRPAVVAHDLQQQRMAWLFQRLYGADRVVVPALPEMPFDPASTQHWGTRSRTGWLVWELLLARPAMGVYRGAVGVGLIVLAGAAIPALVVLGLLLIR